MVSIPLFPKFSYLFPSNIKITDTLRIKSNIFSINQTEKPHELEPDVTAAPAIKASSILNGNIRNN